MHIADMKDADQRRIMSGWTQINNKYTLKVTLYDLDGVDVIEVIWDPHLPSKSAMKRLQPRIDAKLMPLMGKMLILRGALGAGGE